VGVARKGGFKEYIQKFGINNFEENQSTNYRRDGSLTEARLWMELYENCVQ